MGGNDIPKKPAKAFTVGCEGSEIVAEFQALEAKGRFLKSVSNETRQVGFGIQHSQKTERRRSDDRGQEIRRYCRFLVAWARGKKHKKRVKPNRTGGNRMYYVCVIELQQGFPSRAENLTLLAIFWCSCPGSETHKAHRT